MHPSTIVTKFRPPTAICHAQSQWNAELCKIWMQEYSDLEMGYYIDGHVRVYHGSQTQLPRHYVAREKLCLRATTDYWVNAMDGQPFFLINKVVDPGLVKTLENDIVPRLLSDVANQLKSIYTTDVDLIPTDQLLTVRIHHQARHCSDKIVEYLCTVLNDTNTVFPGTTLRIHYELVSSQNPRGQDV